MVLMFKIAVRIFLFFSIGFILFLFLSLWLFDWNTLCKIITGSVGGVFGIVASLFTLNALVERYYQQQEAEEAAEHGQIAC